MEYLAIIACLIISILLIPIVVRIAFKINAVDYPDPRKVHQKIMPRIGGLAIFGSFMIGILIFTPSYENLAAILIGGTIVFLVGFLDDIIRLPAYIKFAGQIFAACIVVFNGIQIDFITVPFGSKIEFELWSIPITILWIVGITNAINLIDGLDGLSAGISAIALMTISGMAISMGNALVAMLGLMLLGSTLGFLIFNFYPAKIFIGDAGAYFLGYMISVLAIMGLFKNLTVFSLIIPIVILGVPIVDTLFAIVRRIKLGQPFYMPDKFHLHHCLLRLGFSHRKSVLILYGLSSLFSISAIFFSRGTMWGSIILLILLLILIELIVEITGLVSQNYRPLLNFIYGKRRD
jgi:UDP-GlcNAc:undecaprenyl-phosphate/decaprenyl-phosphate GlcNAc-1-phosphate transferase